VKIVKAVNLKTECGGESKKDRRARKEKLGWEEPKRAKACQKTNTEKNEGGGQERTQKEKKQEKQKTLGQRDWIGACGNPLMRNRI